MARPVEELTSANLARDLWGLLVDNGIGPGL